MDFFLIQVATGIHFSDDLSDDIGGFPASADGPHAAGSRVTGVVQGSLLGDDIDEPIERRCGPGNVIADHGQHRGHHPSQETDPSAVNGPRGLLAGSREIKGQAVALFCHGKADRIQYVLVPVMIDIAVLPPHTVRQIEETAADHCLNVLYNSLLGLEKGVFPVLVCQLPYPLGGFGLTSDTRPDVKSHEVRRPGVPQQDVLHTVLESPFHDDLYWWRYGRFTKDVSSTDGHVTRNWPAYVLLVHCHTRPEDDLPLPEDRGNNSVIILVNRPRPRVIGDKHVSGAYVSLVAFHDRLDHQIHGSG